MAIWSVASLDRVQAGGDSIVVIVNSANPVDNLSMGELKKLFLSDRSRWDTGKAVAPVMLAPGAPERTSFLKIVCGMNDATFSGNILCRRHSRREIYDPPKEVGSASAVKSFVAGSPGAIGFVKASDLPAGDTTVRAVKVDGEAAFFSRCGGRLLELKDVCPMRLTIKRRLFGLTACSLLFMGCVSAVGYWGITSVHQNDYRSGSHRLVVGNHIEPGAYNDLTRADMAGVFLRMISRIRRMNLPSTASCWKKASPKRALLP